ncbi:hypothetical protein GCE9029_00757 [Grimontia celer]|uniref:DUF2029 domain-containing protein n=2 Tax=Grimontia celer TaxID=1796497 RepID=A0A128EUN9_9GAMM|nr:hypothetical protein GCE9029_00757 [Grimontia celer]
MRFTTTLENGLTLRHLLNLTLAASSVLFSVVFIYCIYRLFQTYDWGQPFTKFLCFSGLFALCLTLFRHRQQTQSLPNFLFIGEALFASLVVIAIFYRMLNGYGDALFTAPTVDIGYTTEHAARLLFLQGENPYLSQEINIRPELAAEHRGFHYGPAMLLGYAPSAFFPGVGYKVMSMVFLAIAAISMCMLIVGNMKGQSRWQVRSTVLIALMLFFLPERLWYEVFQVGANDIYPVSLLLLGMVFAQRDKWLWAGILMGLSFATKFSPAAFLLAMFLRKDIRMTFLAGCVIGVTPMMAFLVWDYQSLMENVFFLRFGLNYDSTSLYSITPPVLHVLFPLAQLSALVYLLVRNFGRTLSTEETLVCFTLLLIIIEVTFKEIHANHLIWFYPLIAFIVATYRHKLFPQH